MCNDTGCPIPYGTCHCGCLRSTGLATQNNTKRGFIKGAPMRYCVGHANRSPVAERFWAKVQKTETCWLWTGAKTSGGYGTFFPATGEGTTAHRMAWILTHGPIPDGYEVAHDCSRVNGSGKDIKLCVRHLKLLTPAEHGRERVEKRQCLSGDQNGSRRHPERLTRGENNPMAKLTKAQVTAMRARYATGGSTEARLAQEYCVSNATVHRALTGQSWAHLEQERDTGTTT